MITALSRDDGPAFGAHAFIWAGDWSREGAERVISGAAEAGLDFVEIPLLDPGSMDVEHTRSLLGHYGLGCSCSLGLPREVHLPSNPEGAARFSGWGGGGDGRSGLARAHRLPLHAPGDADRQASRARRVGDGRPRPERDGPRSAADRGVALGIEAVNRYETYLVNLASQANDLLDAIDEPNVFAHLDTYHMNIEERGFYWPIVSLGSRLGYVHLSESDRGTPGTANVHWDEVFRGLKDVGYRGALVMESFAAVNETLRGATALWRDVVGDLAALVRDGLAFLRAKGAEHGVLG